MSAAVDVLEYDRYLRGLGRSRYTVVERVRFARRWVATWPSLDVPAHEIVEWLGQYEGWTRKTYHAHLRAFYAWLVEKGHVIEDPTLRIKVPASPKSAPSALAPEDLARALEAAQADVRAFLLLGYLAGLRTHEIAKVHGRDVTSSTITVVGKGSVKWTIPTHPRLWQLAQEYPRDGYWFPSTNGQRDHLRGNYVSSKIAKVFREVGIETGAAHRTRHTYATELLRGGANLRVVQTLMRHSSLATTERYLQVAEDEQRTALGALGTTL